MRALFSLALVFVSLTTPLSARTWHVPAEAPTIQAGIDSAAAGDDVLVASGVYPEHDITMRPGIWVHSEQGPRATTVDAAESGVGFTCTDLHQAVTIEGFTILNGRAHTEQLNGSGGGVRCIRSGVAIRDCIITESSAELYGGGIYAQESNLAVERCQVTHCSTTHDGGGIGAVCWYESVRIADCEILENEAGGSAGGIGAISGVLEIVRCVVSGNEAGWGVAGGISCRSPELMIQDCLVTRNSQFVYGGGALSIDSSSGTIAGCTVANNTGAPYPVWGITLTSCEIEIDRTIIAFHEGAGLGCDYQSQVAAQCCDLYGNTAGNDICGDDLGGNFSADPLFCDPASNDYSLDAQSPCLPGNHPDGINCGLVGAVGHGCGATVVQEATWGRIKAGYR